MGARNIDKELGHSSGIVCFNVGGKAFATSQATLQRAPCSMLARMVDSQLNTSTDNEGRIFIDRDPKHFRIILNYLRDGACQLPVEESEIHELLQEIDFYQLSSMRSFVVAEDCDASFRSNQLSATHLRYCIVHKTQSDAQLRDALDLLVECAFGRGDQDIIPPRRSVLQVLVKESAYNPLSTSPNARCRDEALYVAFQQDLRIQDLRMQGRGMGCWQSQKHGCHFIHDEYVSYDPNVYGGAYEDRLHIKTMDVYRHHCIHQLSDEMRRLRDTVLYISQNPDAVQWGLELEGYKDVQLAFKAQHVEVDAPDSPPNSPTKAVVTLSPSILSHICMELKMSL